MNAKQNNTRKPEVSVCSVFFCVAVLIIHASSQFVSLGDRSSLLFAGAAALWRMCHFATYGFVFLAGLRFMLSWKKKNSPSVIKYYFSRILRIVPLYLLWCVVYYVYDLIINRAHFSLTDLLLQILMGSGAGHLYFIPVLLQLALIAPLSAFLRKKLPASCLLVISLLITFIFGLHLPDMLSSFFPKLPYFEYSDRVFTSYLIFWTFGCSVGNAYESFCAQLDKLRPYVFGTFILCTALDLSSTYVSFIKGRFIWCLQDISILYVLSAITLVFTVSRMITKKSGAPAFFERADLAGYLIYLSHILPLELTQLLLNKLSVGIAVSLAVRFAVLAVWMLLCTLLYRKRLDRYHAKKS